MKVLIGHIGRLPNIDGVFSLGASGINSAVVGYCGGNGKAVRTETTQTGPNVVALASGGAQNTSRSWKLNAAWCSSCYQDNALPESKSLSTKMWLRNA